MATLATDMTNASAHIHIHTARHATRRPRQGRLVPKHASSVRGTVRWEGESHHNRLRKTRDRKLVASAVVDRQRKGGAAQSEVTSHWVQLLLHIHANHRYLSVVRNVRQSGTESGWELDRAGGARVASTHRKLHIAKLRLLVLARHRREEGTAHRNGGLANKHIRQGKAGGTTAGRHGKTNGSAVHTGTRCAVYSATSDGGSRLQKTRGSTHDALQLTLRNALRALNKFVDLRSHTLYT
mmetsp:Transcript_41184/g.106451  ORF Transcript_41184/g.106451 Transcript_41184/m.106451 type:complete len:239 (+) Transcript_41184:484-1200(+)